MTSANVSNIPIQVIDSASLSATSAKDSSNQDFMQVMNTMTDRPKSEETSAKADHTSAVTVQKSKETVVKDANEPLDEKSVNALKEDVESLDEDAKEMIAEELDVSEEDVEAALETLGLSVMDLAQPTNLIALVTELSEAEDTADLLVDDVFTSIKDQLGDLISSLTEETGMGLNQIKDVISFDAVQPEVQMPEGDVVPMPEMTSDEDISTVSMQEAVPTDESMLDMQPVAEFDPNEVTKEVAEEPEVMQTEAPVIKATAEVTEVADTDEDVTTFVTDEVSSEATKVAESSQTDAKDAQTSDESNESLNQATETMMERAADHLSDMNASFAEQTSFDPENVEVTLPNGETVSASEIIDQVVEYAKTTVLTDDVKTVEMILQPEGLGKVYMEVSEKDGNITARFVTQNESVKEALENQMVALKEQISEGSTKVTEIEVAVGTHEFERNLEEGQFEREQNEAEEREQQTQRRTRNIDLNNLEELSGLMTEEEELVARMMREGGNTINFTA